jgi:hypothetical protein
MEEMGVKAEKCEDSIRRLFINVCIISKLDLLFKGFHKIFVLMGKMMEDRNAKI